MHARTPTLDLATPPTPLKPLRRYQKELPVKIKSRGKDAHLTHEELCLCMKWKLSRGKFSPRLKDLIQMNTPRLCMTETKKAFRALMKKEDLPSAIQALCNLKGVGPAMASTILTAGCPELCAFMADECLLAIPEIEGIDYTTKELLNFVEQLKAAANRLNKEGSSTMWNPHKVEMALWAYFVLADLKKDLLGDMPGNSATTTSSSTQQPTENGDSQTESSQKAKNGGPMPEESNDSMDSAFANKENFTANTNGTSDAENSRASVILNCEDTNDSMAVSEAPSEALSEAPSEPASEAPSESISESDTQDVPSQISRAASASSVSVNPPDNTDEPALKKMKVDE
ncbi:streptococcal hemagglutinin isoform X2 [Procambarus clarkii]|uniref:streptococcal hemagglutinin isoform X2 n=1 Tax=Procambarus clarkii TaxID=6728 RepID=UPI0037436669